MNEDWGIEGLDWESFYRSYRTYMMYRVYWRRVVFGVVVVQSPIPLWIISYDRGTIGNVRSL